MEKLELRRSYFDTEKELEQLVELQNKVYESRGLRFSKKGFENRYLHNPTGRVISFNAFDGDRMVSHYACIPTRFVIDGRVVRGILSMATVTHPDYRGRGLFKTLARMTYDAAKKEGYEFVIGVANANSFPGFMKYFPFQFVGQLDVKVGYGNNIQPREDILFSGYYDEDIMNWRSNCGTKYIRTTKSIEGRYGKFARTFMGCFNPSLIDILPLPKAKKHLLPKLYVGLGANVGGFYFKVPKFIKHSPFKLIFMDLTDGKLPNIHKKNILFQLWDFDVA